MGNFRGEKVSENANTIGSLRGSSLFPVGPALVKCEWCGGAHQDGDGCFHAMVVCGNGDPSKITNGAEFKKALVDFCTWRRQTVERQMIDDAREEERAEFAERHPPLKLGKLRCTHCNEEMSVEVHLV